MLSVQQHDHARHRESVLAWLRRNGYHQVDDVPADVRRMIRSARLSQHDLTPMEPVTVRGYRRSLTFEWLPEGEQPPSLPRANVYDQAAEALKARPGVWACFGEQGAGTTSSLRKRGLNVSERPNGTARPVVYARWPPPA